jgi:hypothetical protein
MKNTLKIALTAVSLCAAAPAFADSVDVSAVTCENANAMDANTVTMLIFFIDGYTGGEAGDPVFDATRLSADIDKVAAACAADPAKTGMDARKEALGG